MAWDPGDLSALLLWLDAESLGLADSASVTTWTDLSPNGYDYASAGNPPTYDDPSVAPNGAAAVLFDGSNDRLANADTPGFRPDLTGSTVIFALRRIETSTSDYETIWAVSNARGVFIVNGTIAWYSNGDTGGDSVSTQDISVNEDVVCVVTVTTGGAISFYVNGAAAGTDSITSTNDFWGAQVGAHTVSSGEPYQGPMYGLIVCESVLSTDDRQKAEGWLAWRYGFQSSLPTTHPYRWQDPGIDYDQARPDADVTTTGWSSTPLWSKIEEESADGTVITATAS
jgi:hypothetical protein